MINGIDEERINMAKDRFLYYYNMNPRRIQDFENRFGEKLDYTKESLNATMRLLKSAHEAFDNKEISERIYIYNYFIIWYVSRRSAFKKWTC